MSDGINTKYRTLVWVVSAMVSLSVFASTVIGIIWIIPIGAEPRSFYWWIFTGMIAAFLFGFITAEAKHGD